ncbi:hypothetical protein [Hyphococcus sp.]|uniref:hypothetical protein n=1 Tax=Hyphococcus sp. TaxID=2038636 RepID=UPI0035C73554
MNGQFDFLVVGDDEPSLAAAAAAAKAGARIALLSSAERKKRAAAASPAIANFVWRRLDLQDYDLTLEPVSARITLLKEGAPVATYASARETSDALAQSGSPDHLLWRDFLEEMTALAAPPPYAPAGYANSCPPNIKAFAALLSDPAKLERAARVFGTSSDLLGDYFADERLRAHLSAHALAPGGWGDKEAGSARALMEFADPDAWRVRASGRDVALRAVLEQVCQDAGVETTHKKPVEALVNGKFAHVAFDDDEKIKVRHLFFATPSAAQQWGVGSGSGNARGALGQGAHAEFTVRFKLSDGAEPPLGDPGAIFQIIDDKGDIQAARDAAIQGRLCDRLPVEFEFSGKGEVIARSAYFPAAFYEDGEWRGWTGQDRQAAASIIKERLSSRMPGFASLIRRAETELSAPPAGASPFAECGRVIVQPHRHNAISAAVRLIDQVMAGDD